MNSARLLLLPVLLSLAACAEGAGLSAPSPAAVEAPRPAAPLLSERQILTALALAPEDPAALLAAGQGFEKLGRPVLARQYYELVVQARPTGFAAPDTPFARPVPLITVAGQGLDRIGGSSLTAELRLPSGSAAVTQSGAEAVAKLAGDYAAARFMVLDRLLSAGVVRPEEAARHRAANLGALLRWSAPPPAADLNRSVDFDPAVERLKEVNRQALLGAISERQADAERVFLLERLLPLAPRQKAVPPKPDLYAARGEQDRADALHAAGLISKEEWQQETAAIQALVASQAMSLLPRVVFEEPEPEPKKPKAAKPTRGPGAPLFVPTPGIEPPPPVANAPAGAHLLSMATPSFGARAAGALVKEYPELAGQKFVLHKLNLGDIGFTYRLIVGPMEPAQADTLCRTLRQKGQACMPTQYPGVGMEVEALTPPDLPAPSADTPPKAGADKP